MNRDLAEIDHRSRTYSLTNGRIMADFVLGRQRITRDEVEVWTQDLERLGQEGDYYFSLNRYLFLADRS
jgi:arsenite methyltransferase